MLQTQLLPELTANCEQVSTTLLKRRCPTRRVGWRRLTAVAALASLDGYDFPKY